MSRPATPKQVAFLSYMGFDNAPSLTFEQASSTIDGLLETNDQKQFEMIHERKSKWLSDRLIMHPDLYAAEIRAMIKNDLPDILHSYVRSQMVGSSEKLTKAKIGYVITTLEENSPLWWQAGNRNEIFYHQLSVSYPGCVDGSTPERKSASQRPTTSNVKQKGSGCLILLAAFPIGLSGILTYLMTRG